MKIKFSPTGVKVYVLWSFIIPMTFSLSFCLTAVAQIRGVKPAVPAPIKIATPNDSLQYALGAYLGQWITNNGFMISSPKIFKKGMDDVLLNKTLLIDPAGVAARLDSYQKRLISERNSQQEKLLFENVRGKDGVGMLPGGVAYVILKAGNGIKPQTDDSVSIHVRGYLPDGNHF